MANLTREQRAAREAEKAAAPVDQDGLIPMTKDSDVLLVHPTCVEAHKLAGWVVEG